MSFVAHVCSFLEQKRNEFLALDSSRQRRRRFLFFLTLLVLLTLVMYATFLVCDRYLIYYDVGSDSIGQSVPFFLNAASRFSELNFSTWNPSQFLGTTTVQLFNPEYIVSWFGRDAVPTMMLVSQMLKVILAGVFFYLFIGYFGVRPETQIASSLGMAFCGRMLALAPWTAYTAEVTLLAALLWSVERALSNPRKIISLPISFALIVMTLSVYGLVLYTLVLAMYTAFSLGFHHDDLNQQALSRSIGRIALLYLCGVLLSMPSLLVYLDSYAHSARVSQDVSLGSMLLGLAEAPDARVLSEAYLKALSPAASGFMNDPIGYMGFLDTPYLYCGLLSLVGLPFAFKDNSRRQTIWLAVISLFSLAYIVFPGLRFLLSGGSIEASSFRMSSTWVIFVIALLGALGLDKLWKLRAPRPLLFWTIVLVIFSTIACLSLPGHYRPLRVIAACALLVVYTVLLLKHGATGNIIFALAIAALVPVEILVQEFEFVNRVPAQTRESYEQTFNSGLSELLNETGADSGLARVDYQTDLLASPMAYTYRGTESYIGGVGSYANVTEFMSTIGNDYIETLGYSRYTYGFSDPYINALLGVSYVVYPADDNHYVPLGYEEASSDINQRILVNTNTPEFFSFFSEDESITEDAYLSTPRELREELLLSAVMVPEDIGSPSNSQVIQELNSAMRRGRVLGSASGSADKNHELSFEISPSQSDYLALCFNLTATSTASGNLRITASFYDSSECQNPVTVPLYLAAGNESIYIPVPNDGFTRATVAISTTNACDDATLDNIRVEEVPDEYVDYYLDCCTKRRAANPEITSYTSDSIVAQVNAPEAGYLFVPIPYSESWHVYVDGIEQDAFLADYAFIGFEIEDGKHQIELVYQDAAYSTGIALFAVSFTGLITVKIAILRRSASRNRGATIRTGR